MSASADLKVLRACSSAPVAASIENALATFGKKEQGEKPCSKIVSTLFPREFGFDLD
jgi:hypothetical protein